MVLSPNEIQYEGLTWVINPLLHVSVGIVLISESLHSHCDSLYPTTVSFTTSSVRIFSGDHAHTHTSVQSNIELLMHLKKKKSHDQNRVT